ncbi:hypothetical protein D7X48_04075 [bacterium D16-50]|nr:hypothetical protein D7X48_04075 [bacterium D16-50]
MSGWQNEQTEGLCEALLALRSKGECYAFLEDVCTIKEILDISQRLAVAKLLDKGLSYSAVSRETGASTATISRVSRCYEYGSGGYRTVIERCGLSLKAGSEEVRKASPQEDLGSEEVPKAESHEDMKPEKVHSYGSQDLRSQTPSGIKRPGGRKRRAKEDG